MTINQAFAQILLALQAVIGLALMVAIAIALLRGVLPWVPIRVPGHIDLAYLAGAYWLTRRANDGR